MVRRYRCHFVDSLYGRIDFWVTVSSEQMIDAAWEARKAISLPAYVMCQYVEAVD